MNNIQSQLNTSVTAVLVLFSALWAIAQEPSQPFVSELSISVNQTYVADDNTEDRMGFGFGAYHISRTQSAARLLVGLEYNQTNQFKQRVITGRLSDESNIDYRFHEITSPIGVRFQFGGETQFLADLGGTLGLIVNSTEKGTLNYLDTSGPGNPERREKTFEDKSVNGPLLGSWVGVGIKIPVQNVNVILRSDFRYNFNQKPIGDDGWEETIKLNYFRINLGIQL